MRICFLAGSGSIHTRRWVSWFAQKGHDVHIVFPESIFSPYSIKVDGASLHPFRTMPIISPTSHLLLQPLDHWRVRHIIRRIKPDILHAHYLINYGFRAACSGFHPLVLTAWGSDVLIVPKKSKISRWEVNFTLKRADLVTCGGEHMIGELVKLGAGREKIKLIYFGIDTRKFSSRLRSEKLRKKLGILDSPAIISFRSLEPIYDVESLIKAIPSVLKEIPSAKFIVAGDGEQRKYLENLGVSLGISGSIRFVGFVENDELPQYLVSADVYVSTSLSDAGIAVSTAEAMACGLPVVITDFGDNRKWVENGINGFLVPPKSPEALASKIAYLLRNEDDRIRFGQANRQIIKEKNSYEGEMEKMGKLYEELIERYRRCG
ncbi:N-acetyl-alpha-D-glucosaminyl L-malate synthase [subsurface metagenome]